MPAFCNSHSGLRVFDRDGGPDRCLRKTCGSRTGGTAVAPAAPGKRPSRAWLPNRPPGLTAKSACGMAPC